MTGGRLVVMACSARKRARPAPAIDLYDGSGYRVLRKRNSGFRRAQVLILSAEHGLIHGSRVVAPYDRKMDDARAEELAGRTDEAALIASGLADWPPTEVFCHGGELYRRVVRAYERAGVFGGAPVTYSRGGIGEQLAQLARFLSGGG